jgi:hypothetical protein
MMFSQRYKQMIGRCALLFLAGTALQLYIGNVDTSFLAYPWGLVGAVNYLYILIILYAYQEKLTFVRRMYDRASYITSLASMLILTLLFGLIPQDASIGGLIDLLGFNQMSSSWIFVLFLFHFMTIVGLKAIEDVHHWKKHSLPAVLMHVSFFVILVASVFGSGEKVRLRVTAIEGHPVGMGVTDKGKRVELPFTILLKDFSLEEYPPVVHLLPDGSEVVMPRREVKKYLSEVEIWKGEEKHAFDIAVNQPASIGSWKIYQSGYDTSRGKFSQISILECVKDGGYIAVHIAMWTILLSSVLMFIMRTKNKKEDKE